MRSKTEQVADLLDRETSKVAPGERVRSVEGLQDELGVAIGTVIAGVDLAVHRGVPIERRRGPDGGYFRSSQPANNDQSDQRKEPASEESALIQARRLRAQIEGLIKTLEAAS